MELRLTEEQIKLLRMALDLYDSVIRIQGNYTDERNAMYYMREKLSELVGADLMED